MDVPRSTIDKAIRKTLIYVLRPVLDALPGEYNDIARHAASLIEHLRAMPWTACDSSADAFYIAVMERKQDDTLYVVAKLATRLLSLFIALKAYAPATRSVDIDELEVLAALTKVASAAAMVIYVIHRGDD